MKITQFKQMLSVHGTNLERWDGYDPEEIKTFIKNSKEAAKLFKEAETLDSALNEFAVAEADPAILDNVLSKMGAEPEVTATVHNIKPNKPKKSFFGEQRLFWSGAAAACAAAVLLFVYISGLTIEAPPQSSQAVPVQIASGDVDRFLTELASLAEEEVTEIEMLALLELAQAEAMVQEASETDYMNEQEIDSFLDSLFSDTADDPALQEEMDLWELFLAGETEQL